MDDHMTVSALADIIRHQAEILEDGRLRHTYPDHYGDKSLTTARSRLLEACDKLNHLVTGPEEYMMGLAQGHRLQAALQYVCHFRLASHIPADGTPISYDELAEKASVEASRCVRILRLLMTHHIFREPGTRLIAHNRNSRVLLDSDAGAAIEWYTNEAFRSSTFLAEASELWPSSEQMNQTALNLAYDTSLPAFRFLSQSLEPSRADRYSRAMAGLSKRRQLTVEHLVTGYDWKSLPNDTTMVDVGGGNGYCSKAIADANPGLKFVVQDLKKTFGAVHTDLKGRLRFMEYDFFTPQPVVADVYLLRRVLHYHPNKYVVKILQAQVSAMKKPGARIIIMDDIAIRSGMITTLEERKTRTLDISMMSLYNSAERDLGDWKALFHTVDPKLKLVDVRKPPGSSLSIMELWMDQQSQSRGQNDGSLPYAFTKRNSVS
ncbi:Uu.00g006410.m01.CDS01 [Anthostomella pinea]|uniref:Uu.00g006410.m01.CDS01 n=1 Tax=Anthostomella pinea TaxID=933095 RepID=A0AAI8YIW3_9PEZI|nr:Uu.00g006410.m01.CDS01 [Anthostomella pinea]